MVVTPGIATPVVILAISHVTALMVAATSAQRAAVVEAEAVVVVVHASDVEALTIGPVTAHRKVAVMVAVTVVVVVVADPMSNATAAVKWDTLQVPVPTLV